MNAQVKPDASVGAKKKEKESEVNNSCSRHHHRPNAKTIAALNDPISYPMTSLEDIVDH